MVTLFIINGCAILEHMDGSSEEEINKFKTPRAQMWDKIKTLEANNTNLKMQTEIFKEKYSNQYKKVLAKKFVRKKVFITKNYQPLTIENMLLSSRMARKQETSPTALKQTASKWNYIYKK